MVYSIGSNNDFQFENSIYESISKNCEIHTFDPTVGNNPSNKPENVKFHAWGISNKNFINSKGYDMRTIENITRTLGHLNQKIDIFKIDCEGCEYSIIKNNDLIDYFNPEYVIIEYHSGMQEIKKWLKLNNFTIISSLPKSPQIGIFIAKKK